MERGRLFVGSLLNQGLFFREVKSPDGVWRGGAGGADSGQSAPETSELGTRHAPTPETGHGVAGTNAGGSGS